MTIVRGSLPILIRQTVLDRYTITIKKNVQFHRDFRERIILVLAAVEWWEGGLYILFTKNVEPSSFFPSMQFISRNLKRYALYIHMSRPIPDVVFFNISNTEQHYFED